MARVVAEAKGGDMRAAELLLRRLWPERKGRPVAFNLPDMQTAADLPAAMGAVTAAVARGDLTPDEDQAIGLMDAHRRDRNGRDRGEGAGVGGKDREAMTRLADRLDTIEQRLNPPPAEPEIILIRGGLPGPDDLMHAAAGERAWRREPGEPLPAFYQRVFAEARGDGAGALVFGGLPNE